MMIDDNNDGQMIFGDLGGLKLPDICLTGEENSEKPNPGNLSRPGIESGPATLQARMLPPGPQRLTTKELIIYCAILPTDDTIFSGCAIYFKKF